LCEALGLGDELIEPDYPGANFVGAIWRKITLELVTPAGFELGPARGFISVQQTLKPSALVTRFCVVDSPLRPVGHLLEAVAIALSASESGICPLTV
jgi:hypothetical protein